MREDEETKREKGRGGGWVGNRSAEYTFCTLMLWLVLLNMRLARIAFAKRRALRADVSVLD
jgi:hypothetical protein